MKYTFLAFLIAVGIYGGLIAYPILQVLAIQCMRNWWRWCLSHRRTQTTRGAC